MNIRKLYSHPYSAILAALLSAGVFIFMFIYLAVNQRRHIYESSKEVSKEVLRQTSVEAQLYFSTAYVLANSIQQRALILREKNGTRNDIKNLLKDVLSSNPNILGAWVLWETDAYNGNDSKFKNREYPCNGRFGITYFRDNDSIFTEIVPCTDYQSFFYTDAKQKRSAVLSEPYLFRYTNYSNLYFGCTISVPIMSDTAFLGVVGVDINLKSLNETISSVRLFETGFLYLVSPKGVIVSHPDTAKIRENFFLTQSSAESAINAKAFTGIEISTEIYSNYMKESVFRFYYPINLYLSDKPWMVICEIPIEKASSRSRQVVWVATFVMAIGILLIIYLVLNIFERRKYQKSIEQALCEAEHQKVNAVENFRNYLEIFNSTSEAIFIHDAETGEIIGVNNMMLKMYGLNSKEEVIGKHVDVFSSGIEPYNANGAQERIKQAITAGSAVFEWQSKRSDGSIFWSEVSLKFTHINGQNRVLAVVRDISDRKIAQQALEYRERKFRELADLLPLVVWEVDLNARFTYANNIGFKLFGYTQEDLENGITIIDLIAPEDRLRVAQNIKKIFIEGKTSDEEYLALRKDGSVFPVNIYSSVIYENNIPVGLRGILVDITEKKRAEQEIKEREQLYRTVVESLNEALMMVDNNDLILFVNSRFKEMFGYNLEEVIGKVGYKLLIPEERQNEIIEANQQRKEGLKNVYEMQFKAKDGRLVDCMVSGAPVYNAQGAVIGSIGAIVDISELRKAEKAYHETMMLFETLSHMSPVGIFRTDAQGKTTYVNPKWCELSGLTPEQAKGDDWIKAVHPEDRQRILDGWYQRVSLEESSSTEYRFLKPDGTVVWVLGNALPEKTADGINGYIGTITDITQIKQTQEKLELSEKRFRELTDLLPQSIWEIDLKGKVTFVNKFGLESLGYTYEDIKKGVNIFETIVPEYREETLKIFKRRLMGELSPGLEYPAQRKSGERFPALVYSSPIVENGKVVGLRGISIDISEIKKTQKELEKYQNQLEQLVKERTEELEAVNEELTSANEELYNQREKLIETLQELKNAQQTLIQSEKMASLGLLAAGVAHEINNPLNFIQGGIVAIEGYINDKFKAQKSELQPLIDAIKEGVRRSAQIVRSLNQYSRADYTKHSNVDLHRVIDNCLVLLSNQYRNRIEIIKHYDENSTSIYCNEGQLHQSFMNILINAIQAIDGTGKITITTKSTDKTCRVIFEDTGCGIDQENLTKIFDPFFTTKEPGLGTGLGLSITYNIIKEHKGNINVHSEKGKGTKVTVVLPKTS